MKKAGTTIRASERQKSGEVNSGGVGNAKTINATIPSTKQRLPDAKQITLKTLRDLKATLYARAAITSKAYPDKADFIQKRVDADASKIAFAINLISVKM